MDPRLHRASAALTARNLNEFTAERIFRLATKLPKGVLPTNAIYLSANKGLRAVDNVWGSLFYSWQHHLEVVLGELSVFADLARRDKRWADTGIQHFKNFDISECFPYQPKRNEDDPGTLFESIVAHRSILTSSDEITEERAFSLAMLIHLIGDLCTPGHLMCRKLKSGGIDGGLNYFPVRIEDWGATQVHGLFDGTALIAAYGFDPATGPLKDWRALVGQKHVHTANRLLLSENGPRNLIELARHTFEAGRQVLIQGDLKDNSFIPMAFVQDHIAPLVLDQAAVAGIVIAQVISNLHKSDVWPLE